MEKMKVKLITQKEKSMLLSSFLIFCFHVEG